jgi:calcium-dependent protein kinase
MVLADLGFSSYVKPNQHLTKRRGTLDYIAPEVLNKFYNEQADMWSAGVIMYSLFCGHFPFEAASEDEVAMKILEAPVKFGSQLWRPVSHSAKDLILRLLQRDPERRLTSQHALGHFWFEERANKK